MIIKIQLPLNSNVREAPALIYNERKTVYLRSPVKIVQEIMAGRPKVYFKAHIDKNKQLVVGEEVEEQKW